MPILSSNTQLGEESKPLTPKMQEKLQKELNVLNNKIEEEITSFKNMPQLVMD